MVLDIDWNKGDNDSYAERSRQIKNDNAKSFLLLPKFALQLINLWPETQTIITVTLGYITLFLIAMILVLNAWYLYDVSDDMAQAAIIFTTVNGCVQALTRAIILIKYQKEFAEVLAIVWKQFWFTNVLPESQNQVIRKTTKRCFIMILFYVIGIIGSDAAYNFQPMLTNRREFSVNPKIPTSFYESPTFELITVCMWILLFLIFGAPYIAFDTLFCGLVYNCTVQFKILRLRLNNLVVEEEEVKNNSCDFQEEKTKLLIEFIKHHKLILRTCDILKKVYGPFLLIQLIQSGIGICFCTFAGMVIPAVVIQMMFFGGTSILQLFLYCYFGNELAYQSRTIAYAAFRCGWHFFHCQKLSKLLIMLMQKSQLGEELSALGFTSVDCSTFITVLRASFSFYTVLRAILDKM